MSRARLAAIATAISVALAAGLRGVIAQGPMSFSRPAPELVGGAWLNTARNKPIRLADRKGKVTIVEFWTFG